MSRKIGSALSRAIAHAQEIDEERRLNTGLNKGFGYDVHFAGQQVKPLPKNLALAVRYSDTPGSWNILILLRNWDKVIRDEFPDGINPT